jgi:hypothetical protein
MRYVIYIFFVRRDLEGAGEWIVHQAGNAYELQSRFMCPVPQFLRTNEF